MECKKRVADCHRKKDVGGTKGTKCAHSTLHKPQGITQDRAEGITEREMRSPSSRACRDAGLSCTKGACSAPTLPSHRALLFTPRTALTGTDTALFYTPLSLQHSGHMKCWRNGGQQCPTPAEPLWAQGGAGAAAAEQFTSIIESQT